MPVAITVIVPTHQRRERLLVALDSVRRQTRPAEQVIVVADGCTDGTQAALAGHSDVELLDLPKGPGKGWRHRNDALAAARGDVVAYLGDDDLLLPDHLQRVGALYDARPVDIVQAMTALAHPDGSFEPYWLDLGVPWLRERFTAGAAAKNPMVSMTHRAGVAQRGGGWPETMPPDGAGDVELLRRMAAIDGVTTAMLDETTALNVRARVGDPGARTLQALALLQRMGTPGELAALRADIARDRHAFEAQRERDVIELWALRDAHAQLNERYAAKDAEAGLYWHDLQRANAELAALRAGLT